MASRTFDVEISTSYGSLCVEVTADEAVSNDVLMDMAIDEISIDLQSAKLSQVYGR